MLNRRDTLRGLALTVGVASTGWAERALAAAAPAPALTWTPDGADAGPGASWWMWWPS
jgi:gluconate 2-dehydrogenase gamma chain